MFKPLLIILALLFTSVYAQTQNPDLSKSFTAICDAKEYDTCLYSLVLASTSASFGYTIEVYVVVNDTVVTQAQYEIENSFSPEIVNIPVKNNEDILVYLEEFFDRVKDVAEKYNIVTKMGTSKGQTGPPGLSIIIGNFPESTMSHLIYNEIET